MEVAHTAIPDAEPVTAEVESSVVPSVSEQGEQVAATSAPATDTAPRDTSAPAVEDRSILEDALADIDDLFAASAKVNGTGAPSPPDDQHRSEGLGGGVDAAYAEVVPVVEALESKQAQADFNTNLNEPSPQFEEATPPCDALQLPMPSSLAEVDRGDESNTRAAVEAFGSVMEPLHGGVSNLEEDKSEGSLLYPVASAQSAAAYVEASPHFVKADEANEPGHLRVVPGEVSQSDPEAIRRVSAHGAPEEPVPENLRSVESTESEAAEGDLAGQWTEDLHAGGGHGHVYDHSVAAEQAEQHTGEGEEDYGGIAPWVEGYTEEGHRYWYNTLTGESAWNLPEPLGTEPAHDVASYAPAVESPSSGEAILSESESLLHRPGPSVSWGFGGKLAVLFTSDSGVDVRVGSVVLVDVEHVLSETSEATAVASFPGPLADTTPKDLILDFTETRRRECAKKEPEMSLLWGLLHVLCKSDGILDGSMASDAATELLDLLLDRHRDESPGEGSQDAAATASSPLREPQPDGPHPSAAAELEGLLIRGKREAACEHAMKHGMWADALLLSSHMDADTWRMVMSRFATHTYSPGSPLRTLYSLFADSGDRVFDGWHPGTSLQDGLGLWRRNLAMMLANPLVGDTEVIASLGDQLAERCANTTS